MTKASVRALVKGLEAKMREDSELSELIESIDEIASALGELDDDAPRVRIPYVNAIPVTGPAWK